MPEGPEIRRAADRLAAAIVGDPLQRVTFAFPRLKHFERVLRGHRIRAITPRGKALLTAFDNGWTLYTHNQLYGVWKVADAGRWPDTTRSLRVALETARSAILLYSATDIELWRSDEIGNHPFLQGLGPDVLDPSLTNTQVVQRLQSPTFRNRALGGLLLDQGFLAGLGNYLRAEILYAVGLHPALRPCDLDAGQTRQLAKALLAVPRLSYQTRGVEPKPGLREDYQAHEGEAFRFHVFQREGEPCERCGTPIARITSNSRPLFLCPHCQRSLRED
ncbi:endonuclease VIII [Thermomonas sp.]|uniref:endonuclease VIII n=1 Tax=Thermomonas sp. TaxID=1971895 RepID=UPI00263547A1|nr:endonuclease VIII [Thermomonas sp.]